ncbi:MAG: PIN domain-containing protein [Leptolyngbyaceae cyanobacterium bins.59]|nr:PIN domain-containing protein [Leptolyngbyaceae cyanobacterium bins.59]
MFNKRTELPFSKYFTKGLLVDTNILVLWFVGKTNRQRISSFKRTAAYTPQDYDLLILLLRRFQKLVITPNILTEVNSLINQLGEPERSRCLRIFSQALVQGEKAEPQIEEFYIESCVLITEPAFNTFGLTDSSICQLAKSKYLVLTDDLRLSKYLESQGVDYLNFNYIREGF